MIEMFDARTLSGFLDVVGKLVHAVAKLESKEELAKEFLSVVEAATESQFGFVGFVNEQGNLDTIAMSDPGWDHCTIPRTTAVRMLRNIPLRGLFGHVVLSNSTLILDDPSEHPASVGTPEGHPPIKTFLGVPLRRSGESVGLIALANKPCPYTERDRLFVEALSLTLSETLYKLENERTLQQLSRFKTMMEQLPLRLCVIELGTRKILFVNENLVRELGFHPLGMKCHEALFGSKGPCEFCKEGELWKSANSSVQWTLKDPSSGRTFQMAERLVDWFDGRRVKFVCSLDVTEREVLKETLAMQEALLRSVPVRIYFKDADLRYAYVNDAFSEDWNVTIEDLVGKTDADLLERDAALRIEREDRHVLASGLPDEREETIKIKGESKRIHLVKVPVSGPDGPSGLLGMYWDVTHRQELDFVKEKRALELRCLYVVARIAGESKTAEVLLERAASAVQRGFKNFSRVGVRISWGEREATSGPFVESLDNLRVPLGKAISTGKVPGWLEVHLAGSDGEFWSSGQFLPNERTFIKAIGNTLARGLERIQLEQEQAHVRALLAKRLAWERMLARLSSHALTSNQLDELFSKALQRLGSSTGFGEVVFCKFDEKAGRWFPEYIWKESGSYSSRGEMFVESMGIDSFLGDFRLGEVRIVNSPETAEERAVLLPVFVQGAFFGVMAFRGRKERDPWTDEDIDLLRTASNILGSGIQKILHQRVLEDAIRDKTSQLRETVSKLEEEIRVRRGVERELRKAKAAAEAANRAKSEFLANMSHEIRTPLNSIMGFAQLLADRALETEEEREDALQTIQKSGKHLLGLINDMLDISKIEAGKMKLNPDRLDLRGLLVDAADFFRSCAQLKGVTIDLELPEGDELEVNGDEQRLRQVVLNLLSNAIKFTPERGSVGVRANRLADGVEVVVWDTGVGIPKERQRELFRPFAQVQGGNFAQKGTGLGLHLSKKLVELHGGSIWFESTPGRGTSFHVKIPSFRRRDGGVDHETGD
ncbi:MAG: hypothetical protein Kow0069_33630 [Promethearchaeota archaeon]